MLAGHKEVAAQRVHTPRAVHTLLHTLAQRLWHTDTEREREEKGGGVRGGRRKGLSCLDGFERSMVH